jgi:hypothetical protein
VAPKAVRSAESTLRSFPPWHERSCMVRGAASTRACAGYAGANAGLEPEFDGHDPLPFGPPQATSFVVC